MPRGSARKREKLPRPVRRGASRCWSCSSCSRSWSPRRARGLTLIEMLVVLVLVSLLGTLLIQGGGFFFGQYATVKRVHRDASLAELRRHWFASTIQAMVPSSREPRRFAGDASAFEGVTLQALAAEPGLPVRVRWFIGDEGGAPSVAYAEEEGPPWTVTVLPSGHDALAFEYADSAGARSVPPGGSCIGARE